MGKNFNRLQQNRVDAANYVDICRGRSGRNERGLKKCENQQEQIVQTYDIVQELIQCSLGESLRQILI